MRCFPERQEVLHRKKEKFPSNKGVVMGRTLLHETLTPLARLSLAERIKPGCQKVDKFAPRGNQASSRRKHRVNDARFRAPIRKQLLQLAVGKVLF